MIHPDERWQRLRSALNGAITLRSPALRGAAGILSSAKVCLAAKLVLDVLLIRAIVVEARAYSGMVALAIVGAGCVAHSVRSGRWAGMMTGASAISAVICLVLVTSSATADLGLAVVSLFGWLCVAALCAWGGVTGAASRANRRPEVPYVRGGFPVVVAEPIEPPVADTPIGGAVRPPPLPPVQADAASGGESGA